MGTPLTRLDMIKDKEKELKPLYDRMDEDEKHILADDNPYRMTFLNDPNKYVDDVVNVTMNYAGTTIDDLSVLILNAEMQTVVEGFKGNRELNGDEKKTVESYLDLNYEMIDDFLVKQNKQRLMVRLSRAICSRGWIISHYQPYIKKGIYVPYCMPWDARYSAPEFSGYDGLQWASHRTWRSGTDLKKEYPDAQVQDNSTLLEVVTFLDKELQEVWIDNVKVEPQPRQGEQIIGRLVDDKGRHNLGYVPVVIQASPAGPGFEGKDAIKHEGESAIWLDRTLFNELNRIVSIEQTMGMKAIKAGYTHETDTDAGQPQPYPDVPGQNLPVKKGETPELVVQADFNVGARQGRADVMDALKQGGRNIDVGNISQSYSAVAIAAIEELRKKALISRLEGIEMFKTQLSMMMIKQHLNLIEKYKFSGELSLSGKSRTFTKDELDGAYSIRYKLTSKTKEVDIMNLAVASAAANMGIPRKVWVRDILNAQNPEEMIALMDSEKAEEADPVIAMLRIAHGMIDEAKTLSEEAKEAKFIEAYMLGKQACVIIRQRQNPLVPQETKPVEKKKGSANLLPALLGTQGRMGGNGQRELQEVKNV